MAARTLENLQKRYSRSVISSGEGHFGPGPGGRGRRKGGGGKPKNVKNTIVRLFNYIAEQKVLLLVVLVFMLIRTLSSLAGSYMIRPIINQFLDSSSDLFGKIGLFSTALFVLAAVYIAGVISTYFQSKIMLKISQGALEKIRNDLFTKLQKLPISFYDNESRGELMSRFTNDVDNIGTMLDTSVLSLISGAITLVGTLVVMLWTNIWLSLVTLCFVPLFIKSAAFVAKKSSKYYSSQQAALGAMNGYIEETVTGQKVVKVFCHEKTLEEEFGLLNRDLVEKQMKAQFFGGVMGPVMGNISKINYAVTAGIGGLLCVTSGFDIGGLTIFVNLSSQFSQPISELSNQTSAVFSALAGAERVFDIIDRPEEEDSYFGDVPNKITGDVVFENVTFGYNEDKIVLKGISLHASPGQKIAFVGSTGAGKTTITNLINRFYDIEDGKIRYDGININKIKKADLRRSLGIVLQDTNLFTGTVMENIRYGKLDATDDECIRAAKLANAHNFITRLPDGYDTMLTSNGANLSQGQRQLISIARAAVADPPVMILDEATSSIDTRTELLVQRGMDALMQGRTVFVIAHRLSTVQNSDAIMVLDHGRIIERGTHDDLIAAKGVYYQLYTGAFELE